MHKLAGRDLPPSAADEMKEELDDLEAEAEMTQETLDIDLLMILSISFQVLKIRIECNFR